MDMRPKQCRDTQKSSKVEKTKKCETSEQRAKRYSPFRTLVVGGLLATSGMISAEGRQLQEPELAQKNVTQLGLNLGRVPPGFDDYLRKIGTSESDIRDVQRRVLAEQKRNISNCLDTSASHQPDQNKGKKQLSSKDIANLIEKDPEARQRTRQLLEASDQQTGTTDCLNVDNTLQYSSVGNANDVSGREMRIVQNLRIKNECLTNSYFSGFVASQDMVCPSGTTPKGLGDANAQTLAWPATLQPGQETSGANDPQMIRLQCQSRQGGRIVSNAPLSVVSRVTGVGYGTPDRQIPYNSPTNTRLIVGELPQNGTGN
jgi:hypothetical protein